MLIGIAGKAGAGKDTAGKWLVKNHGMYHYAFALPIKAMLNSAFGWCMEDWDDREWKERPIPELGVSPRFLAQRLGTEGRDVIFGPTLWLIIADMTLGSGALLKRTVITDVRFPHEQDWIHAHRGKVIYIDRPDTKGTIEHSSETSLNMAKVDTIIHNDEGLGKLYTELDDMTNYLLS